MRIARAAAWTLAAVYIGLFLVLAANQAFFIFPGGRGHNPRDFEADPQPGCILAARASDPLNPVLGLFEPALQANGRPYVDIADRPTLLYCYGNGSNLFESIADFEPFRKAGINVFIPEYPGYGMNAGAPSERGCFDTASAAYAYLTRDLHIPPRGIVISGWSLGSSVAVDLASRVPAAGLVVISPFTNMADAASSQYPMYPAWLIRAILKFPFANDRKIGRVRCPILDIHSRTDAVVPFWMSGRLLAAAKSPVTRVIIDRARHEEFFTVGGVRVRRQVVDFIERSTAANTNMQSMRRDLPKP